MKTLNLSFILFIHPYLNPFQSATLKEIKQAFRKLSVQLHPDKNPAADAHIQFRNIVTVYDILKDTEKRAKYDLVLKNGMPSWKSGIWYYRKMRKMGLWESALILFSIITVSQYLVSWGAYLEKKHTAEEVLGNKWKKIQKKSGKSGMEFADVLNEIPKPSMLNTLPFQIPAFFWHLPRNVKNLVTTVMELKRQEKERRQEEAEEERRQQEADEEYLQKKEEMKAMKKRRVFVAPEKTDKDLAGFATLNGRREAGEAVRAVNNTKPIAGGFWTDDDLTELIRLVKKYPGGMTNRWETIAEVMNRSVTEVTYMAAKMKERGYRVQTKPESVEAAMAEAPKQKAKKKPADATIAVPVQDWSQEQQRALETAISKYPKNSAGDRWGKIANCVPEKTKEECMLRYKYLVEMVKKQRDEEAAAKAAAEEEEAAAQREAEVVPEVSAEEEEVQEPVDTSKGKGKPRNQRKERKKQMDLDDAYAEEYDD